MEFLESTCFHFDIFNICISQKAAFIACHINWLARLLLTSIATNQFALRASMQRSTVHSANHSKKQTNCEMYCKHKCCNSDRHFEVKAHVCAESMAIVAYSMNKNHCILFILVAAAAVSTSAVAFRNSLVTLEFLSTFIIFYASTK